MAFCQNCGASVNDVQEVCLHCGAKVKADRPSSNVVDNGGFGWGFLGFCIPIVGLVLYLVWKHDRPLTAKAAGLGALIGVIINVIIYIIYASILAGAVGYPY